MTADTPSRIALIGAGVIGRGWAVSFLARGYDVATHDPATDVLASMEAEVARAAESVEALGGDLGGWRGRFRVAATVREAVTSADHVQENAPETREVKAPVMAQLDEWTPADVVIASSSSTLMPSTLSAMCPRHPERVVVGHPFNPVYLMPLVEVVGGAGSSPAALDRAGELYAAIGKRPIVLRQEVAGHLANRLQAALWREAYSLVERGVASVADVDAAISHGPGLRWALLGPLLNQHLSGGAGGLAHVLAHLGPPTQKIMDDLGAPQLTDDLVELLVHGVQDEVGTGDTAQLTTARDRQLVRLLLGKSAEPTLP